MPNPPSSTAALRRTQDPEAELGLLLNLRVTDPEVLRELQTREGADREAYALTALRVGVLALRQAGGVVDAQKLKSEGDRLVTEVERRLERYTGELDRTLQSELSKYFADDGKLHDRVKALTSHDGELARVLKLHVDGDNSALARQLAEAVGKNSPLMKYLSPDQQDGLIATIARVAEERLEQQSKKVLSEFDLNNEDSALKRLIRQIETNFDPTNPKTALGVLTKALGDTRAQISSDLSLDASGSALNRLHQSLNEQLAQMAEKQVEFQKTVSGQLGIKLVQARTTEGGFDFEHRAAEALQQRVQALQDEFQSVGETQGLLKRKTGDHIQIMGAESAMPGARIVFECKRDKAYRVKVALEELEQARKNREADVGVFVMAASTLRDNPAMKAEFPAALGRYGNDIIAVWDEEDPASDVVLDAAIGLARALVVRGRAGETGQTAADLEEMTVAVADLEKQIERFEKMTKTCDSIVSGAENIKDELGKIAKRIDIDCRRLSANIAAIREES